MIDEQQRRQGVDEARPVIDACAAARRVAVRRAARPASGQPLAGRGGRAPASVPSRGWPAPRPSRGSSAARRACAGRGPGCPRRGWPWPASRRRPPAPSFTAAVARSSATARSRRCRAAQGKLGAAGVASVERGEPVLEFGVEPALGLAGLEVEEAEDERAGEAEQRGREGQAHALQRRGEAVLQLVEQDAGILRRCAATR